LDLQSNVDIDHVLRLLRHRPVAVVAVHWPGRCFDLSRLKDICNQHGVLLLEDAAQAFGAHNGSAVAGGQGVAGAYSFQQGKLITCGEGGCVVSNDCEVLERVRAYSDHGMRRDDDGYPLFEAVKAAGDNLRLTGLQGALLAAQLRKLDYLCQTLAATKQLLREQLAGYDVAEWNPSPGGDLGQIFTLRFQGRAAAEEATVLLAQEDILLKPIWRRPYPELFPQRWCMEEIPLATAIADAVRAIPLPPTLTIAQCRQIAGAVSRIRGLLWP
jgi:8-amino-3,8-dideoxy-alpha-D-manno-octulosonate transaminase